MLKTYRRWTRFSEQAATALKDCVIPRRGVLPHRGVFKYS